MLPDTSASLISVNLVPPTNSEGPNLVRATLIALWVETMLYGAFLVLFFGSLYILLCLKRHKNVCMNRMKAIASVMMFLLITGHIACDLVRAIKAFSTNVYPPDVTYMNVHDKLQYAKAVMYFLLSLISDTIIVYRCWVIWEGNRKAIALPLLLCVTTAAIGIGSVKFLVDVAYSEVCVMELGTWALAFFSLTLTTNGLCTLLIVSRIYWLMKNLKISQCTCGYSLILRIIVESAAVYTIALITMIGTYVSKSNLQYIALDALPPIIGIVFELIIALVALELSTESHSPGQCGRGSGIDGRNIIRLHNLQHDPT